MNSPFSPFPDPPFGPGSRGGCDDRHDAARGDRRRGRREMRAAFREHVREGFDPRQGGFGPGFGPRGFGPGGFGPGFGGFGPGFGPGGFGRGGQRGGHRGSQRGGRSRRGDVRAAILALLAERPMHGYEMIQQIEERSQGLWKPSPGSVYPTLQLLVDEGLLVARDADGAKKLFELTEDGRAAAEKIATPPWETIAEDADPAALKLRGALGALMGAVAQSAHAATAEQQQRIVDIVDGARREVYQILGESSSTTQD